MSIPVRSILLIGTKDAGIAELVATLTANRNLIFPCLHRVSIDSEEGKVQADLKLFYRENIKVAINEPKPDVILIVFNTTNEESSSVLSKEWTEDIQAMDAPKILIATGMEQGVKYLVDDSEKKDPLLNIHNTFKTAVAVGASALFEISIKQVHRIREVFVHALRASIDPEGSKLAITEDSIIEARNELFDVFREEGIGVPLSVPSIKKNQNPKLKKMITTEATNEKPKWQTKETKSKKTYYSNSVTGETLWQKPSNFDGDLTQEQKEKRAEKRFEREIDKLRQRHYAIASNDRIGKITELTREEEENFVTLMQALSKEHTTLEEEVRGLREELKSIKQLEQQNDIRGDRIQDLADLRSRKDTSIHERVQADVDHERHIEGLEAQLDSLKSADRCKTIPEETFDSVKHENRRLTQQLGTIFEEAKTTRLAIKNVTTAAKNLKAKTDGEEMRCMKGEAKIQTVRNNVMSKKEAISKLKAKKEWITNELILQRGTEANVAQQLKEWKREVGMLTCMLNEIDDKISKQEIPISKYMTEEKRKARVRGGPLILDEEDMNHYRSRQSSNGDYKAPTNRQLMEQLKTNHDRISLQYQFHCTDVAESASLADEHLQQIQQYNDKYIIAEQINSHVLQDVMRSLHNLLLLLRDIGEARRRSLFRLQRKEDRHCERLCNLQDELDTYLSYSMNPSALIEGSPADPTSQISGISKQLQRKIHSTRLKLYATTEKVETLVSLRREQSKALKAVTVEKENIEKRIRQCESDAEASEEGARKLVTDTMSLVNSVEEMPINSVTRRRADGEVGRFFLSKSLTGLHPRSKDIIVKRCSSKQPPAAGNSDNGPSKQSSSSIANITNTVHNSNSRPASTKSRVTSTARPPSVVSSVAEDQYSNLVSSLKKEFGIEKRSNKTDKREGAWRKTW